MTEIQITMHETNQRILSLGQIVLRGIFNSNNSKVKSVVVSVLFLLLENTAFCQMPIFEADSLLKHYTQKMNRFIDRDTALADYYSMDLFGINMYAGSDAKKANKIEYRVTWSELPIYKNMVTSSPREEAIQIMFSKGYRPFPPDIYKRFSLPTSYLHPQPTVKLPLKGLRIAIDPGHIASDTAMGRVEDKYLRFKIWNGKDSVLIALAEGILTWQTANILAGTLRAEGAEVFMTRRSPEITAFGKTYAQWRKDDFKRTLDSLFKDDPTNIHLKKIKSGKVRDENSIFRYVFRDAELRKRSELINAFNPDLTVIIHYNVDEKNKPWNQPSPKNFCMTFVGGSFQRDELGDSERRFDFLRLLLTDDIEKSTKASGYASLEFKSELDVPLAKPGDATYLLEHCLPAGVPGVYNRNLSLTRLIQGTIIYGETLYQDNYQECVNLSQKVKFAAEGNPPFTNYGRINEVADAYHKAILLWSETL